MAGRMTSRIEYTFFNRQEKKRDKRVELIEYNNPGEILDYLIRQVMFNDANDILIQFDYRRLD